MNLPATTLWRGRVPQWVFFQAAVCLCLAFTAYSPPKNGLHALFVWGCCSHKSHKEGVQPSICMRMTSPFQGVQNTNNGRCGGEERDGSEVVQLNQKRGTHSLIFLPPLYTWKVGMAWIPQAAEVSCSQTQRIRRRPALHRPGLGAERGRCGVGRGQHLVLVDVDLDERRAGELLSHLHELRPDPLARAAPGRREVDNDRLQGTSSVHAPRPQQKQGKGKTHAARASWWQRLTPCHQQSR